MSSLSCFPPPPCSPGVSPAPGETRWVRCARPLSERARFKRDLARLRKEVQCIVTECPDGDPGDLSPVTPSEFTR